MILDDAETELLKTYITKLLEDNSDADSDVLADYMLALINTDEPEAVTKPNCIESLRDFLGDRADSIVEQVFRAIAAKSYDPSRPQVQPAPTVFTQTPGVPGAQRFDSRKRSFQDGDDSYGALGFPQNGNDRPAKQPRRGGRGGGSGFEQRGGRQQYGAPTFQQQNANMPQMPGMPGMPPFNFDPSSVDPNNPLAGFLALQQAMMANGMPGFPLPGAPPLSNGTRNGRRCRDYDTKGFCARGATCQYEHGDDPYIVGNDEYDPTQATLLNVQPSRTGFVSTSSNGRGRGGQRSRGGATAFRGGGKRSEFSHAGPNMDTSITSLVVEQIPEDKFDEQSVRDFFGEFGSIEEVNMQPYKRLAVVKFEDYESAKAAYDSPKVVFDNRFVKVYWYKADSLQAPPNNRPPAPYRKSTEGQEEAQIDTEALAKKQEEAQQRHEKYRKQVEEARKQKEEIEARMKEIEADRKKMADMLAKKAGSKEQSDEPAKANGVSEPNEQTKALRETLAKLEAEAKSLGIDPNPAANGWAGNAQYPIRGRGGLRGRARGRGFAPSFRGGWAGGGARGNGVLRLDNRPKSVSVSFSQGSYDDHDEVLRSWLLFNSAESTTLTKHPSLQNAALVEFEQRYLAENFMRAASTTDFPLHGKVEELAWYKPAASSPGPGESLDSDVKMEGASDLKEEERSMRDDVDDRDDEERWG